MLHAYKLLKESLSKVTRKEESILDAPRGPDLCPDVWEKNENGSYTLTEAAERAVAEACNMAFKEMSLEGVSVRIIGSITSNAYSDTSDIDVHISADGIGENEAEELNSAIRGLEYPSVGTHPIEVYVQSNMYQDLMSVGCYDFLEDEWLTGPEILPEGFSPFDEYYEDAIKHLGGTLDEIRITILKAYETARTYCFGSLGDGKLRKALENDLYGLAAKAKSLVDDLRAKRSELSSPKSEEEAEKMRESREWKICDASMKLVGKFGYIDALKAIAGFADDEVATTENFQVLLGKISDSISNKE